MKKFKKIAAIIVATVTLAATVQDVVKNQSFTRTRCMLFLHIISKI